MNKSYNILNDFPEEQYNLLVPVQSIQEINSIYRIVVNIVNISTDLADKEIYEEKNAEKTSNEPMYALTHKALLKLTTAANGQTVETARIRSRACEKCIDIVKATNKAPVCGTCPCLANVAYRISMKFPELSGGWRIVQATREIDFSALGGKKEGQIARMKEFAGEHAETKAMSRCIRKGLHIKNAYTILELEKPFVVAYPVLDARDADVKRALIAGSIASSNLLYGSGLNIPQLQAGQPREVNKETGEIVESDYEVEQPQPEEPAEQPGQKYFCNNPQCLVEIAANVAEYSQKTFGKSFCMKCQQAAKKGGKK